MWPAGGMGPRGVGGREGVPPCVAPHHGDSPDVGGACRDGHRRNGDLPVRPLFCDEGPPPGVLAEGLARYARSLRTSGRGVADDRTIRDGYLDYEEQKVAQMT